MCSLAHHGRDLVDASVAAHIAGDSGPRHSTLTLAAGWQRTWRIPDAHVEGRMENALGFLAAHPDDQLALWRLKIQM